MWLVYINILQHTGRLAETNGREQFKGREDERSAVEDVSSNASMREAPHIFFVETNDAAAKAKQINPPYGEDADQYPYALGLSPTVTESWQYGVKIFPYPSAAGLYLSCMPPRSFPINYRSPTVYFTILCLAPCEEQQDSIHGKRFYG